MSKIKIGVLLANLGTPEAPTPKAVRLFLKEFLSDRRVVDLPRLIWLPILYLIILVFRPSKVALNYKKIWTKQGSPLMCYSLEQQKALQMYFDQSTSGSAQEFEHEFKVELAMTYGKPSIKSGLQSLVDWKADQTIVLPLYPQYSNTTTASVEDQIKIHNKSQSVSIISHYYDNPTYIEALALSIKDKLQSTDKLIFSFHGIPKRYVEAGDPYQSHCVKTAKLVAEKLNLQTSQWEIAYQSRMGREEWLMPYLDHRMSELVNEGNKNILVVCPGFSSDCLETLEEIALQNKQIFINNGGERFTYVSALNAAQSHIKMMAELIKSKINAQ